MQSKLVASGVLLVALTACGIAAAQERWSDDGRLIDSESYDRTAKGFYFTLYPGEDPVQAVRRCAIAMRELGRLSSVSCFAYTSKQRFETRRGKLRVCYSAVANWWGEDEPVRVETVDRLPRMCPAR
ncbi:hypothetical protein SAMN02800694_0589 [Luteibacter sp. UNCMF331Sha3.1]|uniref:hypothetical protein n=1 Tax=Luteibacter sp. UNCMF331Sha3.1 TaxID=1502760 RepID=UPI0008B9A233|nr:hypothetical protein [Luteibacter sp. UNCMF331Sha3.1]SEM30793.1 hypothetical protein SAMN02800694_0589 [Luteibacter sp. UNCMF331Sha3.1]